MNLDISKIYSNYYLRIIIFAAFAYKRYFDNKLEYQSKLINFIDKRSLHGNSIDIVVKIPESTTSELRDLAIDSIVYNREIKKLVEISFSIDGINKKDILIDLNDEEKYELFLYG